MHKQKLEIVAINQAPLADESICRQSVVASPPTVCIIRVKLLEVHSDKLIYL